MIINSQSFEGRLWVVMDTFKNKMVRYLSIGTIKYNTSEFKILGVNTTWGVWECC